MLGFLTSLFFRPPSSLAHRWRFALLLALFAGISRAAPPVYEYQLKTAYIFHLAELTEWPETSAHIICISGKTNLREHLPALQGQAIGGQQVHINIAPEHLEECNILFVGYESKGLAELVEIANAYHILLVSDQPNFAQQGGMIEIALRDDKLKLIVNLPAVKNAGLKLSSKLLRIAEIQE